MAGTAGRPSEYSDLYAVAANDYVDRCEDDKELPYVERLALNLRVNEDTCVEWAKIHSAFGKAYNRIKILQKLGLKQRGLSGEFKSNVVTFLLSSEHGLKTVAVQETVERPKLPEEVQGNKTVEEFLEWKDQERRKAGLR